MNSNLSNTAFENVLHPIYLPFPPSTLCRHFAPVGGTANVAEDYLRYYRESADRYKKFTEPQNLPPFGRDVKIGPKVSQSS